MIDIKLLRDQPDVVRASQRARGEDESIVDAILAADERRRATIADFESVRAEQKASGKGLGPLMGQIGKGKKAGEDVSDLEARAEELKAKGAELAGRVKELDAAQGEAQRELDALLRTVGNVIEPGVPTGGEEDYVVRETVGQIRDFAAEGFEPKDHLELGELLGAIDMERGAKVSGARFSFLKGVGARLELALMQLGLDLALENGFVPVIPPTLVRPETMQGTGFDVEHDDEIYRLERDDLYLVGTSEVALAGYHADEIMDVSAPVRYAGWSTCYRREAGSAGKDTRGIIRVHQFNKLEMFVYCTQDQAEAEQAVAQAVTLAHGWAPSAGFSGRIWATARRERVKKVCAACWISAGVTASRAARSWSISVQDRPTVSSAPMVVAWLVIESRS